MSIFLFIVLEPIPILIRIRLSIGGGFAGTEPELIERDSVANLTILFGEIGDTNETTDSGQVVVSATRSLPRPGTVASRRAERWARGTPLFVPFVLFVVNFS